MYLLTSNTIVDDVTVLVHRMKYSRMIRRQWTRMVITFMGGGGSDSGNKA